MFMSDQPFQVPPPPPPTTTGEDSFDVPVESVILPSEGKLYPHDHMLSGEKFVDIKCMTAREEDLLTSRALLKSGTVISKLLQSCLINKAVDPDMLLVGDRNAILIAIRVTGYGSDYKVRISCPSCDEQFDNDFSLSLLQINPLGAEPIEPGMNLFKYVLPLSKIPVEFKLLTGKDEKDISEETDKKKKIGSQETVVTSRLFYSIVSINGDKDRGKIRRFVSTMRAGDARSLRQYIDKIEPDVIMKQPAKCPHCYEESEVNMPLGASFFWPDSSQ